MRVVKLSDEQKERIIERIADSGDRFSFEEDFDGSDLIVTVDGWQEVEGFCENDYFGGTGGWVVTGRSGDVTITGDLYHPESGLTEEVGIDDGGDILGYLNAA